MTIHILLIDSIANRSDWLMESLAWSDKYHIDQVSQLPQSVQQLQNYDLAMTFDLPNDPFQTLELIKQSQINLPLLLLATDGSEALALRAWRQGFSDYLPIPFESKALVSAIRRVMDQALAERFSGSDQSGSAKGDQDMSAYLKGLDYVVGAGKAITADLNLEDILSNVVAAAAHVADADTATILLPDEQSGDLFVQASYALETDLVENLRLRVEDSLAGQAMQTGRPVVINGEEQQKIKTAYLVKSLVYMPLQGANKIIGVLGVDNRLTNRVFTSWQIKQLGLLADFASIALENADEYLTTQRERDTLDAILTGTADPVLVVDFQGCILLANPAARMAFNMPTSFAGPVSDVIDHDDVLHLLAAQQNAFVEVTLADERTFQAHMTVVDNVGCVMVMHDISQLKEVDRLKTSFVANVSQDLRSPLTAIMGYVELLSRAGALNETQTTFADRIMLSAQTINSEITDLLDLSRIETSSSDLNYEHVLLSRLLQYALATVEGQVAAKQIDLRINVEDHLTQIWGNAQRLKQMIRNLLDNAIQFTPEQGTIQVLLRSEEDLVMLQVEDNGIGIALEDQAHIFDKFYRAESIREEYKGSGLGLAIVKSILDRHDGRIWVQSEPGKGSIFTVLLPTGEPRKERRKLQTRDLVLASGK